MTVVEGAQRTAPRFPEPQGRGSAVRSAAAASHSASFDWELLPDDVLQQLCLRLEAQPLSSLLRTCKRLASFGDTWRVFTRRELMCFHTKQRYTDCVLGVCLRTERRDARSRGVGAALREVGCQFDLLSDSAFHADRVRRGVWHEGFDEWVPLLLDAEHTERAMPLLECSLSRMASPDVRGPAGAAFNPLAVLEVMPKVLNAMVVALMQRAEQGAAATSLHASEKALLGFCAFHHILLEMAARHPVLRERAAFWVAEFERDESRRNKHVIHDLGEFLVLLYLCPPATWQRLAPSFVREVFVRNVLWNLRKAPALALLEAEPASEWRLRTTLQACGTSVRLLMFQAFFMREVACPPGATPARQLAEYRTRLSRPRPGTAGKLQAACDDILGLGRRNARNRLTWSKFFARLGLPDVPEAELCAWLRDAVRTSERRGYHTALDGHEAEVARAERTYEDPAAQLAPAAAEAGAAAKEGRRTPHCLFVRNLPRRCSREDLVKLFQPFGAVAGAKLPVEPGSVAAAHTAAAQGAEQVLREHGELKRQRRFTLTLDEAGQPCWVAGEAAERDASLDVALIARARVLAPRWRVPAPNHRGFGFVCFETKAAASAALQYATGLQLRGRTVGVSWARNGGRR